MHKVLITNITDAIKENHDAYMQTSITNEVSRKKQEFFDAAKIPQKEMQRDQLKKGTPERDAAKKVLKDAKKAWDAEHMPRIQKELKAKMDDRFKTRVQVYTVWPLLCQMHLLNARIDGQGYYAKLNNHPKPGTSPNPNPGPSRHLGHK